MQLLGAARATAKANEIPLGIRDLPQDSRRGVICWLGPKTRPSGTKTHRNAIAEYPSPPPTPAAAATLGWPLDALLWPQRHSGPCDSRHCARLGKVRFRSISGHKSRPAARPGCDRSRHDDCAPIAGMEASQSQWLSCGPGSRLCRPGIQAVRARVEPARFCAFLRCFRLTGRHTNNSAISAAGPSVRRW